VLPKDAGPGFVEEGTHGGGCGDGYAEGYSWSHQLGGHCGHSTVLGFGISSLLLFRRGKLTRKMYASGPQAKLGFRVTSALVNITYIPTVALSLPL
jgi:hypothetical protein